MSRPVPVDMPTGPDDPRLKGWYHTIELGDGMVSTGVYDLRPVADNYGLPKSMSGMTALDVGTGDGFFAFEMESRGAARVVAVDVPRIGDCDWLPSMRRQLGPTAKNHAWLSNFRVAHSMRQSSVEHKFCDIYDLSPWSVGIFDVVFCGSLLLHLQNPLRALHSIRSVTREMAVIETAIDADLEAAYPGQPLMRFGCPHQEAQPGESTYYWSFTTAALVRMLQYADFADVRPQGVFELPPTGVHATSVVASTEPQG
ncbi:MAG: class I SAM-dependent methyltransferase [Acidimicrobiales bacterium]